MTLSPTPSDLYSLCVRLFPINRSLTGDGVRETLAVIKSHLPNLTIHEVPSGTSAYDWTVPQEWNIRDAYIVDPNGTIVVDFKRSNLHVVGYSVPVDRTMTLDEIQPHLHSLPDQPDAIPYVTSYYRETWGFCLADNVRKGLIPGNYQVRIDSTLSDGHMTYGELLIPGRTKQEIFFSTYVCHPSMAHNELSGPVVTTYLARWIETLDRRYSYRIVFTPETIGAIYYLSRHLGEMKDKIIAGFVMNCMGDDAPFSFLPSRYGNTLADRVACHVLAHACPGFTRYSYLDRRSDERQYCAPGVDLPVCSVMRSKHGEYPEYHTSLDNLDFISPEGLRGSYELMQRIVTCLERNEVYNVNVLCEPQLSRRGLYPTVSTKASNSVIRDMMNLLAYCDGTNDLVEIANRIELPVWDLYGIIDSLSMNGVVV